ncbi:rRNA methyltransferase [Corynebacterium sphenisci DSM 44792]|uniref:rRNA methyltransferase n=1 Tax=Corynebacterium sphenisci DSM 44792 TaxID=1437874 RepID=A0A1L7CZN4_9CORY|nr:RNA methyltransferase [Corynebacterium sphenisci]APT91253.1 rRNA methyltransferase [Corynebacterium sphenisci DSM 44792]
MGARVRMADPADPRLAELRDLNRAESRPDRPGGSGLVVAEGRLIVERLLASRYPVRLVAGTAARLDELAAGPGLPAGATVAEVDRATISAVVGFDFHRGVLATADRAPEHSVAEVLAGARTLLVLEGVGDHENIGALFRNAAGLGVDGVLFGAACADPLYRRSVRVSMGHVLRVPFAHLPGGTTTWQRGLAGLRERGFRVVAMTPGESSAPLWEAMAAERVALVVGAEGPGLTEHAMRACEVRARIPMAAGADSLNVATAAAVGLYERARTLAGPMGQPRVT